MKDQALGKVGLSGVFTLERFPGKALWGLCTAFLLLGYFGLVSALAALPVIGDPIRFQVWGGWSVLVRFAVIAATAWVLANRLKGGWRAALPFHFGGWRSFTLAVLLMAGWFSALEGYFALVAPVEVMSASGRLPDIGRILAGVVGAPVAEELWFRGYGMALARKHLTPTWSVVVTAAAFAAVHAVPGRPLLLMPFDLWGVFGFGLLMSWLRLRSISLVPLITVHALGNGSFDLGLRNPPTGWPAAVALVVGLGCMALAFRGLIRTTNSG